MPQLPRPLSSLLTLGWALCAAACIGPPVGSDRQHPAKEEPAAETWRRAAMQASSGSYRLVEGAEKLPSEVRGDSLYWSDRFFQPKAHPFHQAGVLSITGQPAKNTIPDLIRFQYRVDKLDLTVIESSNFMFVWVAGPGLAADAGESRLAGFSRIADSLFNTKSGQHDWQFSSVALEGKEERFSTNPKVDAWDLRSWEDRADGGVQGGMLYFLFFKKNPEHVGYQNAFRWFDETFRKSLGYW